MFECLAWGGLKNTAAWDDFQADEGKYEKCKSNENEDVIPF
jgi:hypothetical protein